MSTKPGIGNNFVTDEIRNYYLNTKNSYATLKNGIKTPLGRYLKTQIFEEGQEGREAGIQAAEYNRAAQEEYRNSFATEGDFLSAEEHRFEANRKKLIRQLKRNNKL